MGPGSVIVQKTAPGLRMSLGGGQGMTTTIRRNVVQSNYAAPNRPVGEAGKVSKESVATVLNTRGHEKKELGDLNSKLANYIDKVKYMEACNKAMTEEIDRLRKMKGYTQDRIKEEYEEELKEARATINTLSKEIAPLQARILKLDDKVDSQQQEINMLKKHKDDLQGQVQKLNQLIGDLEGELATLRNQLDAMGKENDMLKQDNLRLRDDNERIREDFEAAVTKQINAENERDALAEELQFTQDTLNAEIEELRSLLTNFKSVQPDIQKMWKSEFKDCIQAIQAEYNDQLSKMTDSTERRCQERIASMENAFRRDNTDSSVTKTENKTLKSALSDNKSKIADLQRENDRLRKELEDLQYRFDEADRQCDEDKDTLRMQLAALEQDLAEVMHDLEGMKSHNLDLELEIACYRKLLEGEENSMKRIIEDQAKLQSEGGAQLSQIIAGGKKGGSSSQTSS